MTDLNVGELGAAVRAYRARNGLTQRDMAELAGISERALRYIEKGKIQRPRQASIRQLTAILQRSGGLAMAVLGPLVVRRGDRPVVIARPQLRSFLGLLALHANQVVSHAEIIEVLWGHEPPGTYRELLHGMVSRLRKVLGSDVISTRHSGYRLDIDPDQLDLLQFDAARESGDVQTMARALGYWRSSVLEDLPEAVRHHPTAIAIDKRRLATALAYAEAAMAQGECAKAADQLRLLLPNEPLHEGLHAKLMLALAANGQQAESLALYAEIHDRLVAELGVRPGDELRKAHVRVLRGKVAGRPESQPQQQLAPAQLPADVNGFAGRGGDLARIDTLRTRQLVVIHAIAGMGKTALAVRWGHRELASFPDGQLYVNLRGFDPVAPPVDPGHVLGRFLRAFGVDPAGIPRDSDERAAQFRSLLAGKRVLVVLDNAATADQVRPLLPGTTSCLVLVTSRNRLSPLVAIDGGCPLALAPLEPSEASALLEKALGRTRVDAEPAEAAELARLCGHLPLALRLAAGKLSSRPQQTITEVIGELIGEYGLAALRLADDPRASVSAAFDLSYAALDPAEQTLFRRLGLIPGPDFTVPAAASLLDTPDPHQAAGLLDRLIVANLVEPYASGRYRLHDLVRLYATEMCGDDRDAYARLMNWYLNKARAAARLLHADLQYLDDGQPSPADVMFADAGQGRAWLQAEEVNIVAAIRDAAGSSVASMAWLLADATNGYFLMRMRNLDEWHVSTRAAIKAAEQVGDGRAHAAMQLAVGAAYWRVGDLKRFVESCTRSWELARRVTWELGMVHSSAFICEGKLGLGLAREVMEPVERLITDSRTRDFTIGVVHGLILRGSALAQMGELRSAERSMREGLAIGRQSNSVVILGEALRCLGGVYSQLGRTREAEQAYADSAVAARRSGAWLQQIGHLIVMTRLAYQSGDRETAESLVQQALTLGEESGNRVSHVDVLVFAGWLFSAYGCLPTAFEQYRRAREISHQGDFIFAEAEALIGLARTSVQMGDNSAALSFARQALRIAETRGYQVIIGQALTALAEAEIEQGNLAQAKTYARRALDVHRRTGHEPGERTTLKIIEKAS